MTCGFGHGKIHLQQQPTAESEVAISFSGWTASSCPHGGSHHLKVTYAFLPSDPVSCSVAKASADHQWSARDRDDPPRCYRTTLAGNKLLLCLSLQARTIQPAAVTACEESFHTVQPSAFRTSDFRPSRSQARHLHCRRTTSPQHVRKQQIALLFSCESFSAAHLQPAARTTRTSGPASALLSRTSVCLTTLTCTMTSLPSSPRRPVLSSRQLSLPVKKAPILSSRQHSAPPTFVPAGPHDPAGSPPLNPKLPSLAQRSCQLPYCQGTCRSSVERARS